MFYAPEVLRRGGRFYLCWVADSWPARFGNIKRRQLQSANIVQLCDDLQEVIQTESGAPGCRFSLRLSTRLLHGLLIIYERKTLLMLNDLCMFDANILKFTKTRWELPHEKRVRRVGGRAGAAVVVRRGEEDVALQETETIVAEREAMANVVANIDDITLKEPEIPARLQTIDNFGEENLEEAVRQLESMMEAVPESARGSLLPEPEVASSLDKTAPLHGPKMSLSVIQHSPTLQDDPSTRNDHPNEDNTANVEIPSIQVHPTEPATLPQPMDDMELEVLAEAPATAHRNKRRRRLIIDKDLQIHSETMKERTADCLVETVKMVLVPAGSAVRAAVEELARRPARGWRGAGTASPALLRLYTRNLAPLPVAPLAARDIRELFAKPMELTPAPQSRKNSRKTRVEVPQQASTTIELQPPIHSELTLPQDLLLQEILTLPPDLVLPQDLALPEEQVPEIVDIFHQRPSEDEKENVNPAMEKRPSEDGALEVMRKRQKVNRGSSITATSAAAKRKTTTSSGSQAEERRESLQNMLLGAGLAEPPTPTPAVAARAETPLGSLDRTKVSLGDSDDTTESASFMNSHWSPHATMLKIISLVQERVKPLTVLALLQHGPVMPGKRRMVATYCFTSILKLKQAGFLNVKKNPETLEIVDIELGPRLAAD